MNANLSAAGPNKRLPAVDDRTINQCCWISIYTTYMRFIHFIVIESVSALTPRHTQFSGLIRFFDSTTKMLLQYCVLCILYTLYIYKVRYLHRQERRSFKDGRQNSEKRIILITFIFINRFNYNNYLE